MHNMMLDGDDSNAIEEIIGFDFTKLIPGFLFGDEMMVGLECQKDFMKCVSGTLFKGGVEHMHEIEGISG